MLPGQLNSDQKDQAVKDHIDHDHPDGTCDVWFKLTLTAEQCLADKATLEARKAALAQSITDEINKETAALDAQLAQYPS